MPDVFPWRRMCDFTWSHDHRCMRFSHAWDNTLCSNDRTIKHADFEIFQTLLFNDPIYKLTGFLCRLSRRCVLGVYLTSLFFLHTNTSVSVRPNWNCDPGGEGDVQGFSTHWKIPPPLFIILHRDTQVLSPIQITPLWPRHLAEYHIGCLMDQQHRRGQAHVCPSSFGNDDNVNV